MRAKRPRWLRAAAQVYRLSARLMPKSFRERFGWESEEAFQRLVEDALERKGSKAAVTTAAAACGDIARAGVAERTSRWRGARPAAGLAADAAQSIRVFRREPLLASSLTLILALVAGPTAAVLAVLYGIVLAPLPYPDADRLVAIGTPASGGSGYFYYQRASSVADFRAVDGFAGIGGYFPIGLTLSLDGPPERIQGVRATGGLLTNLGVPFAAGRDLRRGDVDVVVVTNGFAIARFGSAGAALDRSVGISNRRMRVVGVAAYRPPLPSLVSGAELYIPHVNADAPVPARRMTQEIVIARLKPGIARGAAEAQMRTVAADVHRQFGGTNVQLDLVPLRIAVSGALRLPMLLLAAAAAVVFLIGISSLASLVLARAASRAGDIAVRTSLGASRWRLVRGWLVDGAALAVPGALLGLWLGLALLRYLRLQLPSQMPLLPEAGVTGPIVAASAALALVSVGLFALAPIVAGLLKAGSASFLRATHQVAGLRGEWSQSLLIAGQVAVSVVLVASAIWLSTSLWRALSRPIGFDPDNLVVMSIRSAQPPSVQLDVARRIVAALEAGFDQPADGAAATTTLPALQRGGFMPARIRPDQPIAPEPERPEISVSSVSTGYFAVVGITLLEGRTFVEADEGTPGQVVVVSRSFAQRFFPDGALGRFVAFSTDDRREVIGIVEDVHAGRLTQESLPQCYTPLSTAFGNPNSFVVRTSQPIDMVRSTTSTVLREMDPNGETSLFTASDAIALPLLPQMLSNRLILGLAAIAVLVAVVNIYALSAFAVVRRRREIGIRVALGATAADATRLVMRRGLAWTAAGLIGGIAVAIFLAAPAIQSQLFKTEARDPQLLSLAFATVAAVAVLASWIPARRAAAIDPAITLRAE